MAALAGIIRRGGRVLGALLAMAGPLAGLAGCAPPPAPPGVTVPSLNLVLFQGLWHEIASTHPWRQQGCVCSQTRYTLHGDEVVMRETCRVSSPQGREYSRVAIARPLKKAGDAQWVVSRFWPFEDGYWVLGLALDQRWAVVGSPDRQDLWILARAPRLDPADYQMAVDIASQKGWPVKRLQPSRQGCVD